MNSPADHVSWNTAFPAAENLFLYCLMNACLLCSCSSAFVPWMELLLVTTMTGFISSITKQFVAYQVGNEDNTFFTILGFYFLSKIQISFVHQSSVEYEPKVLRTLLSSPALYFYRFHWTSSSYTTILNMHSDYHSDNQISLCISHQLNMIWRSLDISSGQF